MARPTKAYTACIKSYMESILRSRIPAEILQLKVLPFLPIASLCRLRSVSKNWNTLISQSPEFASSHARASSPEEHVLITVRDDLPFFDNIGGWEVLDVANNKVFTVSHDFLSKYVNQECGDDHSWIQRKFLAADGGIFFLMDSDTSEIFNQMLLVCNPILKTAKMLPPSPGYIESNESVVMSTNRISMDYEIVVFMWMMTTSKPNPGTYKNPRLDVRIYRRPSLPLCQSQKMEDVCEFGHST